MGGESGKDERDEQVALHLEVPFELGGLEWLVDFDHSLDQCCVVGRGKGDREGAAREQDEISSGKVEGSTRG